MGHVWPAVDKLHGLSALSSHTLCTEDGLTSLCTRYSLPWHPIQQQSRHTLASLCVILDRAHVLLWEKSQRDMATIAFQISKDVFHVFFSFCHSWNITQTQLITSRKNNRDDDFSCIIQCTCITFSEDSIRNDYWNSNSSTSFSSNKKSLTSSTVLVSVAGVTGWTAALSHVCMCALCSWETRSDPINPVTKP